MNTADMRLPVRPAAIPADGPPLLLVVIDTEEEFDWAAPFDRASRAVANIQEQHHAQKLFETYGIIPTYVIDNPVATTPESAAVFRQWQGAGQCIVGTHLHPWVSPPDREAVTTVNSYPGNLPAELEAEKLAALTQAITENVGRRPDIYKAGRYGLGPNTPDILKKLDYQIDLSVVPATTFESDGGPNFKHYPHEPYWFGRDGSLLEVPLTRGYPGILSPWGEAIHDAISTPSGLKLHLPGIFSRLGLVERGQLTPEGVSFSENARLARHLRHQGRRVFTYAYHSSSLLPGGTPYVRDLTQRQQFLDGMDRFFEFFTTELGGRGTTPYELRDLALSGVHVQGPA